MSDVDVAVQRINRDVEKNLYQNNGAEAIQKSVLNIEEDLTVADISAADYVIRREIFKFITTNSNPETKDFIPKLSNAMKNLFTLFCFTQKVTSTNETFASYQQIFEMLSLKQANNLFPIMDELCTHFRKNPAQFTPAVKQGMLRLCNDLLRRLSATGSRDIKFSGKVQLFLTRLFPIDEKSALNLTSNFHLENTTEFTDAEKSGLPLDEAAVKKYSAFKRNVTK